VNFTLSVEVEQKLEQLELGDPISFELIIDDLELIDHLGFSAVEVGAMFGEWAWISGPTGRVSYWLSPDGEDQWLIESVDVH
jgi:hypothetical protein